MPQDDQPNTYLVVCAYEPGDYISETAIRYGADRVIVDLIGGQFPDPLRVIATDLSDPNAKSGTWVDVSDVVAEKIVNVALNDGDWLCRDVIEFCELHGVHVPHRLRREAA